MSANELIKPGYYWCNYLWNEFEDQLTLTEQLWHIVRIDSDGVSVGSGLMPPRPLSEFTGKVKFFGPLLPPVNAE